VRHIKLVLEDEDFEFLKELKAQVQRHLRKRISWERFFLHIAKEHARARRMPAEEPSGEAPPESPFIRVLKKRGGLVLFSEIRDELKFPERYLTRARELADQGELVLIDEMPGDAALVSPDLWERFKEALPTLPYPPDSITDPALRKLLLFMARHGYVYYDREDGEWKLITSGKD